MCLVVVELTFLGLDHIGALRVDGVSQGVVLHTQLTTLNLLVQMRLVVPRCLLLVHETASRRLVLLLVVTVELTHDLVEGVHLEAILT